eukprot:TRINITY_DN27973_c1_g1_i7.p1 TRINITY_DN27973_c1_g1~~TRINITY_DN27973_c1_g1_i7.p1  ORF type:complete len:503 (-),score=43.09 TRINITY_DN27973_c1_g1_i7:578-2086(-)
MDFQVVKQLLKRFIIVEDKELTPSTHAFASFFCILLSYYLILPLRDDLGVELGVSTLSTLFVVSLLVTVIVSPMVTSFLAKPNQRKEEALRKLMRYTAIILFGFYVALQLAEISSFEVQEVVQDAISQQVGSSYNKQGNILRYWGSYLTFIAKALFFVWVGLQNNILMSCLWARCAEIFTSEGGKRLFGFFGAGATFGQLVGSILVQLLAPYLSFMNRKPLTLILFGVTSLYLGSISAGKLVPINNRFNQNWSQNGQEYVVNGVEHENDTDSENDVKLSKKDYSKNSFMNVQLIEGFAMILNSRYLTSVCIFILMNNFTGSMFYFQKSLAASALQSDKGTATAWFASVSRNQAVVVLTLQLFVTGQILTYFGVQLSLMLTPLCCLIGLGAVTFQPLPVVVMFAEVLRKTSNYVVSKPAREILFTVVSQDEKYKAKVCIDTIVLRVGDTIAAGTFRVLVENLGFTAPQVAKCGVCVCIGWLMFSSYLGVLHNKLHKQYVAARI